MFLSPKLATCSFRHSRKESEGNILIATLISSHEYIPIRLRPLLSTQRSRLWVDNSCEDSGTKIVPTEDRNCWSKRYLVRSLQHYNFGFPLCTFSQSLIDRRDDLYCTGFVYSQTRDLSVLSGLHGFPYLLRFAMTLAPHE